MKHEVDKHRHVHSTCLCSVTQVCDPLRLPWWLRWENVCLQWGRPAFNPWVGKIPWRRKWQPAPIPLPGKTHGQRSLTGYSPQGSKESGTTEQLHFHFCIPLDCSLLDSSAHGTLQARILEWVATSFSRGSSWPRNRTRVSCSSCIAGRFFTAEPRIHRKLLIKVLLDPLKKPPKINNSIYPMRPRKLTPQLKWAS